MESIILVVLGTIAGILVGRLIIRPMINRRSLQEKNKKYKGKNKKK